MTSRSHLVPPTEWQVQQVARPERHAHSSHRRRPAAQPALTTHNWLIANSLMASTDAPIARQVVEDRLGTDGAALRAEETRVIVQPDRLCHVEAPQS